MKIQGVATSSGLSLGVIKKIEKSHIDISFKAVSDIDGTIHALDEAIQQSLVQLKELAEKTKSRIGEKESKIFEAHQMMLEDPEYSDAIRDVIRAEEASLPYAVDQVRQMFEAMFSGMDNPYMQERAADINDISYRVINNHLGLSNDFDLEEHTVIYCEDLQPSDTAALDPDKIVGILTQKGGKTSHSAIIANSLGIPAVSNIKAPIEDGAPVIVNAVEGWVIVDPTSKEIETFRDYQRTWLDQQALYDQVKMMHAVTLDGQAMDVVANIAKTQGLESVIASGAEGVGLFRTEFLYMNRQALPSLEEQFEAYKQVLETFGDQPVVIRTFDIGGDKAIDYLNLPEEMNPFLGYRAIRISLDRQDIFKVQLKALVKASVYGNLKIMFPMISCIDELQKAKDLLEDVKSECREEGIAYSDFEVGMMVEIPAVAMMADQFAKYVDFFSIGTNDLLQYTVAVDRMNEKLSHLYTWYHPALLKMIDYVAQAAHQAGIWIGICGESAGDPLLLPYFLGIGIDELSMSQSKIGEIKYRMGKLSQKECLEVVTRVKQCETANVVKAYLGSLL